MKYSNSFDFDPKENRTTITSKLNGFQCPSFLLISKSSNKEVIDKLKEKAQRDMEKAYKICIYTIDLQDAFRSNRIVTVFPTEPKKQNIYLWKRYAKLVHHILCLAISAKESIERDIVDSRIASAIEVSGEDKIIVLRSNYLPNEHQILSFWQSIQAMKDEEACVAATSINAYGHNQWVAFIPSEYLNPEDRKVFNDLKKPFYSDPLGLTIEYA